MDKPEIITLTLNPCIDKTVYVRSFRPGETNRVLSSRADVGGKGLNVSRVLYGSGISVLTAGLAAKDVLHTISDEFTQKDMPTLFAETGGKTRVNLKIVDTESGVMTELNEPGTDVGGVADTLLELLLPFLRHARVLVLSGSLPPDVPSGIYHDLVDTAKRFGVKTVLDADVNVFRQGVAAAPYAVKPNLSELEHWAGRRLTNRIEILSQIRSLHASGISLVCVSMGADGALFSQNGQILHTVPFPIHVGSPAAAGDAMAAMLAASILRNLSLADTAKLACAAGTCTAAKAGTQTAVFSEILEHTDKIDIREEKPHDET